MIKVTWPDGTVRYLDVEEYCSLSLEQTRGTLISFDVRRRRETARAAS